MTFSSGLLGRVRHDNIRHIEPAAAGILLGKCDRTERKRILMQGVVRNGAGNPDLRCSRRARHGKGNLDKEGLIAWECASRGVEAAILDLVVVCEEQGQKRRVCFSARIETDVGLSALGTHEHHRGEGVDAEPGGNLDEYAIELSPG